MSISIYTKENQADGNFNYGEILEKKPIGFLKMTESLNHIQIYFTGLMRGHQEQKVQ